MVQSEPSSCLLKITVKILIESTEESNKIKCESRNRNISVGILTNNLNLQWKV